MLRSLYQIIYSDMVRASSGNQIKIRNIWLTLCSFDENQQESEAYSLPSQLQSSSFNIRNFGLWRGCKLLNRADNIRQTKVNVNIILADIMCTQIYQTMAWTLPMSYYVQDLFNVGTLRTQMFIYIHTSTSSEKQFRIWFQTKSKFYPRLDRRH